MFLDVSDSIMIRNSRSRTGGISLALILIFFSPPQSAFCDSKVFKVFCCMFLVGSCFVIVSALFVNVNKKRGPCIAWLCLITTLTSTFYSSFFKWMNHLVNDKIAH